MKTQNQQQNMDRHSDHMTIRPYDTAKTNDPKVFLIYNTNNKYELDYVVRTEI